MNIFVTGSAGFIGGYLVAELLDGGHHVIGVDNFSKYGPIEKSYQEHPQLHVRQRRLQRRRLLGDLAAGAITWWPAPPRSAASAISTNTPTICCARTSGSSPPPSMRPSRRSRNRKLKKITVLSSSMVFENATLFPTPEGHQMACPPPHSTYGFQKLACEYFAKGAWEQYKLPYTICRPFNCVGIGERRALGDKEIASGNVKLAMSHVVPDLVQKIVKGQKPLHLLGSGKQVRCYTYGGDLAKGIVAAIFHPAALNNDFNLSTPVATERAGAGPPDLAEDSTEPARKRAGV
jgi:UDP-glucose 4-epimerase